MGFVDNARLSCIFFAGTLSSGVIAQTTTVHWALGGGNSAHIGPPDARVFYTANARVQDFDHKLVYTGFASMLGVDQQDLARTDIIAFSSMDRTSPVGFWESSRWTITQGANELTFDFDETQVNGGNPYSFQTGSVLGPTYKQFFNIGTLVGEAYAFVLIDLPSEFASYQSRVQVRGGTTVGLPGQGSPAIDAFGVVPEPASALILGAASAAFLRRRRSRAKA